MPRRIGETARGAVDAQHEPLGGRRERTLQPRVVDSAMRAFTANPSSTEMPSRQMSRRSASVRNGDEWPVPEFLSSTEPVTSPTSEQS